MPIAVRQRRTTVHQKARRLRSIPSALLVLVSIVLPLASPAASSGPFVWARSSDALTLDPHAVNEGTTHALNHHIYEPLLVRGRSGKLEPALATSWRQAIDPKIWVFELREGVTFHDSTPLTAADVIFSLERASAPTSDLRTRLQSIKSVEASGPREIQITTQELDPLLPIRLTDIFIMSKAWATQHGVVAPQNYLKGATTYAATNANGTGPYRLVARDPGTATKLARNDAYWGWLSDDQSQPIAEIVYRPVPDDKARITALLDGSIDFVQDVPLNELDVLRQAPGIKLKSGPENRVIFLGLSVAPTTADGKPNPLHARAVRQAISIAIDRFAIQREIMLGQSIPTGVIAPPGINGFPSELDVIPPRDLDKARSLLKSAASPAATLTLDCPNDRYVNDAAICEAVAKHLAEIGLEVTVKLRPKGPHFQLVRSGKSQLYLLGWGVPTFDSAYIFTNLFHTRTSTLGTWNGTGFSSSELDQTIARLPFLPTSGARARAMTDIWLTAHDTLMYVPIHVQTLLYAMKSTIDIEVDISNAPKLKNAKVQPPAANE